jgi:putative two-component system response regulator
LRDRETEGHSRRVANFTLALARAAGIDEALMKHIWRGSMLHDAGKLGIPDSILLKPGSLTAEEWSIMRMHPVYAYTWLAGIAYLRPSLDIPYCHHEKWNGTGYPRGLAGEEIPLTARLFAIVDVWDALISDRPYRKALSPEAAWQIIRGESGKHFDPYVVRLFAEMMNLEFLPVAEIK